MLLPTLRQWIARCGSNLARDRYVIGYASGNFGKALLLGSFDVTLLFLLTDIIGMAPQRVGLLMLLVLGGDLVFDLVAGTVAARAERWGIGYPALIALFAAPCALAFCAVYSLPLLRIGHPAVVAALLLCLRCAYAMIDVPHNSLLARVTVDSRARGRASGYRTIFSSAAGITVASVIAPLMHGAAGDLAPVFLAGLGVCGGLLFCGSLLLAAWSSAPAHFPQQFRAPPRAAAALFPVPDRLFAALAAIALITGFALPMFTKTLLYLCTYVLQRPAFAGQLLLVLAVSQLAGAMLWIGLVRQCDKTVLLAASHAIAAGGFLLFAAAGSSEPVLLAVTVVIGVGSAGVYMLPWGILADIIDFAEFRHRARRETVSFAAMLVLLKGGSAAALATIGWTLGTLGYVPSGSQPPAVLLGIKGLAFGVPAAGAVLAIVILRQLDIGHARHARVSRVNRIRRDCHGAPARR